MKNLIIIGARGFGREVYDLALNTKAYEDAEYTILGFLDDKSDALAPFSHYPPIIDTVENYEPKENDVFVCALGSVEFKKKYVEIMLAKNAPFINLIDKTALVKTSISDTTGLLIFAYTFISVDVQLGNFITVQNHATMGHDAIVKDWCHISAYCSITGYTLLEEEVTLQTGSKVVPHKKIGKGATVGACSLVLKNVKPHTSVFGIPALKI